MTHVRSSLKKIRILVNHERKVKCLSCHRLATANLIAYADGYIGICSACGRLAYIGS